MDGKGPQGGAGKPHSETPPAEASPGSGADSPVIASTKNRQVAHLRRWIAQNRECRADGILIADGVRVVAEALQAGLVCRELFLDADLRSPKARMLARQAETAGWTPTWVNSRVARSISTVETPQGVVGVFERPEHSLETLVDVAPEASAPPLLVAAGLQDPSNVGAITRSALALGAAGLITIAGSVDPFHHRAVRASMGGVFHLPIVAAAELDRLQPLLRERGYLSAGLSARASDPIDSLPRRPTALFLGAEGSGLEPSIEVSLDRLVRIPIRHGVESLGVAAAAAIALYAIRPARSGV